jgi:triacylglycerol lipase
MIRSAFARLLFALVLLGIVPAASAQSDYTKTRHPIVLVHGLLGFDSLFGVYDYWYGVPSDLRSGGAKVFVANVSSVELHRSARRAADPRPAEPARRLRHTRSST